MEKTEILKSVYKNFKFDEIIDYGLEHNHISSSDILDVAYDYEKPKTDDTLQQEILDEIEESLDKAIRQARKENKESFLVLPDEDDVMQLLEAYYEQSDLLDYFDNDTLLDHIEGSYEMDSHDERVIEKYMEQLEDEKEDDEIIYTPKEISIKYTEKLNHFEFRRYLCDITGLHYHCSDDELFSQLKDKITFH